MSMTTVNAKTYVARIIGGESSQEAIDQAGEAILRTYQDWETKKFWLFLLKDTSNATLVSGLTCTVGAGNATVSAPTTGALDFVNVGQTVTVSSGTATLAAGTTVSSFTRNIDGTVATITLSNAFGGSTSAVEVLSFSANIPIIAGTNDYNLPNDFCGAYSALLLTVKSTLTWRNQRFWDRVIVDSTQQGTPAEYTNYNPQSELSQNFGTARLKFDRVPNASDTLFLRYFRKFTTTGTNLDVPDAYLYQFLDRARGFLLEAKRAQDDPAGFIQAVKDGVKDADEADDFRSEDEDADACMKSQYEMGGRAPLWNNGQFDPFGS